MSADKCLHESSSSLNPIISGSDDQRNKGQGHYAINLAFCVEDETKAFLNHSEKSVYTELTQPLTHPAKHKKESTSSASTCEELPNQAKWPFWRIVISGCMIAITIILLYLWIHVQYISPMFVEVFQLNPSSTEIPRVGYMKLIAEPVYVKPNNVNVKSVWKVEYDYPPEFPFVKMNVADMRDMINIECPRDKFALALHLDSNAEYAENWLKACGNNVAYFRADGNPSVDDIDRLIIYVKNAQELPRKATLRMEKGEDIEDNADFQVSLRSDEIIKSVEISGFITPKTIQSLGEVVVPYVEELTIKGGDVCNSLRRALRSSEHRDSTVSWSSLSKLHILETQECKGMYDLIYSSWDMPILETVQVRKSIICSSNVDYIKEILDANRIMKVDFADNVCFDDTLQRFPFMCQASA